MKAYLFPGQGAQFPGMGQELYESNSQAKELFQEANQILGFEVSEIMFNGTSEDLKQTKVTQPAVFLHSVILALAHDSFKPDMVAGHSLGEFSALVASGALDFSQGLTLVSARASAMQKACEARPSTMAAILGLEDKVVEDICEQIEEIVVPANYNSPGQLVISGTKRGIDIACERLLEAGARRALPLAVGGAFHSPLMEPAREELAEAIMAASFKEPICKIYQNVDAQGHRAIEEIQSNLIAQLTSPVRWTASMQQMISDGATHFIESGPGKVLQGLVKKLDRDTEVSGL